MKITHALFVFILASGMINAQKKYEKMAYKPVSMEAEQMTITAKDVVSTKEYTKFRLALDNKSDKIIVYKPEESKLMLQGGKEMTPSEKWMIVHPTESASRVVNFKGPDFMVSDYQFQVDGIYRVSDIDQAVEAPEFMLPPSTNTFKAGNFNCSMLDLKKETDKTTVKFDCQYTGDKIGIINPGRAAIKLPDATEIANAKGKSSSEVLMKGQHEKITLSWNRMEGGKATDMQLIKMQILWRNTFVEADPIKIPPTTLQMSLDEAASK